MTQRLESFSKLYLVLEFLDECDRIIEGSLQSLLENIEIGESLSPLGLEHRSRMEERIVAAKKQVTNLAAVT